MKNILLGALDQSTTSTKFLVFNIAGQQVAKHMIEHKQITQKEGWLEHDPKEIIQNTMKCFEEVALNLQSQNLKVSDIKTIGITNQRETTVAWNKKSGEPYMNAIVWNDSRTKDIAKRIQANVNDNQNFFKRKNGLPINTYFSAFKMKWMLENGLKQSSDLLFGTMDTWVLWNLTKGKYLTDVTNASRTFLLDLAQLKWDDDIISAFGIPRQSLPTVTPSGYDFGKIQEGPMKGISINAILGDQQAACVGHGLFNPGSSKNTYGTGSFVLSNIGNQVRIDDSGILTTVLFQKNEKSNPFYAFEGSIETGGSIINWAKDKMNLFTNYNELNQLVASVKDNGGVYFVPAFSGLYSPYWNLDATGTLLGITQHSSRAHILRALYEAISYRTKDVLLAMENIGKVQIDSLNIDGGLSQSDVFCQIQADILQKGLTKPIIADSTCLGAALFAGLNSN